jgi:hypothetical protein
MLMNSQACPWLWVEALTQTRTHFEQRNAAQQCRKLQITLLLHGAVKVSS